ncbi:MAG: Ig-like domain-containing protein, partial [Salinigranum sp.]
MTFWDDDRGVTVQVGAVLLLGILVISMSMYQVTVVPSQNEQVEFKHSQRVQQDMLRLRSSIQTGASTGIAPATTVELGTRYPSRTIFVNPPPASGTIRTTAPASLSLDNVSVVGNSETADDWKSTRNYSTRSIVYQPTYNLYQNAPETVYQDSVLFNQFNGTRRLPLSGQSLIRGRHITLVTVDGSLSRSEMGSVSVDPQVVSASSRTVSISNTSSGPLTLSIPTNATADQWENDTLSDQLVGSGGYVRKVVDGTKQGYVTIVLKNDTTYDLRMAKVGVGSGVADEKPRYLTLVRRPDPTVINDSSSLFTLEVRDKYNNPVNNVTVDATATAGSFARTNVTSDGDGQAQFTYSAPSNRT